MYATQSNCLTGALLFIARFLRRSDVDSGPETVRLFRRAKRSFHTSITSSRTKRKRMNFGRGSGMVSSR